MPVFTGQCILEREQLPTGGWRYVFPEGELERRYRDGASLLSLARHYGLHVHTVRKRLLSLGVKLRPGRSVANLNRGYVPRQETTPRPARTKAAWRKEVPSVLSSDELARLRRAVGVTL